MRNGSISSVPRRHSMLPRTTICREHNLTLSSRKFQLADKQGYFIFAGYKLSREGCIPDPNRMTAVSMFPRPECRKHLQSLFSLVAQFQAWAPDAAACTANMRKLLSAKVAFTWTEECEREFVELKALPSF